jgi:hypothetical protein
MNNEIGHRTDVVALDQNAGGPGSAAQRRAEGARAHSQDPARDLFAQVHMVVIDSCSLGKSWTRPP